MACSPHPVILLQALGLQGAQSPWGSLFWGEADIPGIHFYLSVPLSSLTAPLGGVSRGHWRELGSPTPPHPTSCSPRCLQPGWAGTGTQ